MRELPNIDYTLLGLKFILKTHDILFNFALCFIHVKDLAGATKNFKRALRYTTDPKGGLLFWLIHDYLYTYLIEWYYMQKNKRQRKR